VSNAGERLGHLRDRVLDAARIQRHDVVLDLNAGTGLLAWEILRRAPEGGTWTLARDRQAGEGLRQQAERLPEMERPVILVGEPEELPALLALRGEGELRFDAIVGRNTLGRTPDKAAALRLLAGLLRPTGRLSLAETVARHTQRLYDLVGDSSSRLGENLHRRVRDAEEAIYADAGDPSAACCWRPLVNWEAADLERLLIESGFGEVTVEVEAQTSDLLVSPAVLDHWFAPVAERDRPSYAQHLLRGITPQELAAVKAEFQRQLAGQTVPWRTETAFLTAQAG
jgi:putative ATPase